MEAFVGNGMDDSLEVPETKLSAQMTDCPEETSGSDVKDFKTAFKFFKTLKDDPVVSAEKCGVKLADASNPDENVWKKVDVRASDALSTNELEKMNLKPIEDWIVLQLRHSPGSFVIRNPFTPSGHQHWIKRCLTDFPLEEDKISNLDSKWSSPLRRSQTEWFGSSSDCTVLNHQAAKVCDRKRSSSSNRESKKRKSIFPDAEESITGCLIWKLRWITLGYHHDWDTKIYSEEKRSEFPQDLAKLCKVLANALGFMQFTAQAAIVNYYHLDSTLSIHQDISEPYKEAPLFSISFGQPAIFLIGPSRNKWPNAVCLRSGDIFVMSGKSRLDFHAVPKIFYDETVEISAASGNLDQIERYLQRSRININIRQVLKPGELFLPS